MPANRRGREEAEDVMDGDQSSLSLQLNNIPGPENRDDPFFNPFNRGDRLYDDEIPRPKIRQSSEFYRAQLMNNLSKQL